MDELANEQQEGDAPDGEEGATQVPHTAGQANAAVAPAFSDIVEVEAPAVDEEPAQWRFKWGGAWGDK